VSKPINCTRDSSIYTVREGNHVRDLQWTSLNGVCERQTGRGTRATSGRLRGALDRSLVHEFSLDFHTAVSFTFTLLTALTKSTYYTGSEICKGHISRDRRVSDVTKYGLEDQGSISGRGIFNFTATSTQALGLTKFMSSWYRRGFLQGKKRPKREVTTQLHVVKSKLRQALPLLLIRLYGVVLNSMNNFTLPLYTESPMNDVIARLLLSACGSETSHLPRKLCACNARKPRYARVLFLG
jgi:hypothetical protein